MKTYYAKTGEVEREWLLVDATDQVLGRLSSEVAQILKGKHRPQYTPHVDTGDFVVVVNADKIVLTGNKMEDKKAYYHTGYPGGLKEVPVSRQMEKDSSKVVEKAIKGMLPKNTLGRQMAKKLKVYSGPEHPHEAQNPRPYTLKG